MRKEHYQQDARLAEHHWWWSARRTILRKVLERYIPGSQPQEILEVGCSTGSNLPMLSTFGKISALESDQGAAEVCKRLFPNVEMFQQSIPENLNKRFTVICAFDVIEHIENEDKTISWFYNHLNEEGRLFLTVPAMPLLWSQYDVDAHHYRRYTKCGLVNILNNKFDIEYISFFNTYLFPAIASVRLLQRSGIIDFNGRDKEVGSKGIVNSILRQIFASERLSIPRFSLPFGVSLLAVARKPPVQSD